MLVEISYGSLVDKSQQAIEQHLIDYDFAGNRKAYFDWLFRYIAEHFKYDFDTHFPTHYVVRQADGVINHRLFVCDNLYAFEAYPNY